MILVTITVFKGLLNLSNAHDVVGSRTYVPKAVMCNFLHFRSNPLMNR